MYEPKGQSLLSTRRFVFRMLWHLFWAMAMAMAVAGLVACVGIVAHLWFEDISWHDAMLNPALITGGIWPFIAPASMGGKIFFSLYSLLVGLLFVGTLSLILAPVAYRLIHKFHLDGD
ncbi:two pore domain potassium channel family protein [Achromobacter sp. SD115]|uniref:two pore domain potassium channel family protein n=1 Tax=Achromobacter sp. SD115 TaxID=2782011 RepID=UPI001A96349C|nr:two pore domain potassium channel family protein [Achromobacter sp. SD115]MBO1012045.1 two pore domain potassium channel family protein [Achromobacter sp. SD115]